MKIIEGGVTAAKGFLAGAVSCGIKKSGKSDLALLFSGVPSICAGTFTTNKFKSGSLILTETRMRKGIGQAIVVNSGNANCCVGKKEIRDAEAITDLAAKKLRLDKAHVLIASTGIIGRPLPVAKIKGKIPLLVKGLKRANATRFSKAIMTTDTVHKEIAVRLKIGSGWITIGGAAKGSGMICPNMATMLCFITTDALITKDALRQAFKKSVSGSFNTITVDGDMSTNDTAIVLANGMAGNNLIKRGSPGYSKFLAGLEFVTGELARKIVLDGEGATRFVEILVKGAKSPGTADALSRHVADSSLIKTMIAGADPNWGRVASSIGSAGVDIKKDRVDIYFDKHLVMKNGAAASIPRKALLQAFKNKEIGITIDLKSGRASSRIWTCDLTKDYVKINASYET